MYLILDTEPIGLPWNFKAPFTDTDNWPRMVWLGFILLDENGEIAQKTEDIVGPYELHDFFLYYFVRFGFTPEKIHFLAVTAFEEKYTGEVIEKWLKVFLKRFYQQQFKRSCIPDGPKVGSINLSPRGDWRMPSDAVAPYPPKGEF